MRPQLLCSVLLALALGPVCAQEQPLASLSASQARVVQQFLAKQRSDGVDTQPVQALLRDLDSDGEDEILLRWAKTFGNSEAQSVSVLRRVSAGRWRPAGTVDVQGNPSAMSVQGTRIEVSVQRMAPGDPRCCPSLKAVQKMSYAAGKLMDAGR